MSAPNPRQKVQIIVAATLGTLATVFVAWWLAKPSALQLVSTCPRGSHTHMAFVVDRPRHGEDYTRHQGSLVVFDVTTGARVATHDLGSWEDDDERPLCMGLAGDDRVWVRPAGVPRLEVRALSDGSVVTSSAALQQRTPALASGILALGWDSERRAPTASLRDGHQLLFDATTLGTTRYEGTVTMTPLGVQADAVIATESVPYYVGGMPELLLDDGRRVTLDGHPRSFMQVGGERLFGDRDFYMPTVLLNPGTARIEWPDPPSLLVVEETLVGSHTYRVTRIGLDGTVLFSFDPHEALPASTRYRPTPWTASHDGSLLLHIGSEGFVAIDAATGVERYRRDYSGEARPPAP